LDPDTGLPLSVLEPAFYWRIQNGYGAPIPDANIRVYAVSSPSSRSHLGTAGSRRWAQPVDEAQEVAELDAIITDILALDRLKHPRVVIHLADSQDPVFDDGSPNDIDKSGAVLVIPSEGGRWAIKSHNGAPLKALERRLIAWSDDSVGEWCSAGPRGGDACYEESRSSYRPLPPLHPRNGGYRHYSMPIVGEMKSESANIMVSAVDAAISDLLKLSPAKREEKLREYHTLIDDGEHVRPCKDIFSVIKGNRSCFDKCK
jgi:hypothetical protein